ncbi:MAG: hypothetical protein WC835_03285 [Candidatus Paceibacterota bacterium]
MTPRRKVMIASLVVALVILGAVAVPSVGQWTQIEHIYKDGWSVTFYAGDKMLGRHEFAKKPKLAFDKNRCVTMPTKEEYCGATVAISKTKIQQ